MNLEQLKIFLTVADNRSFTRAAQALYISHSTTSRNVAALEEDMGVALLIRDNRSVRLTPAGELLYREGARLLKKVDSIESAVRNTGLGTVGQLSLASVNIYSQTLSGSYRDFCRKYPEVVLGIYHREAAEAAESVIEGEADLGVTFSFVLPEDVQGLEIRSISRERFCVVVPVGHALAGRRSIGLEELQGENLIAVETQRWGGGDRLTALLSQASPVPTVDSLFLRVKSGNGVALVPQPIACEYGSGCAMLALEEPDTDFDIVLLWRRDNPNPSLALVVDTILKNRREAD